jgi:hypothetical protein
MENKNLIVARILSGIIRCHIYDNRNNKKLFVVKSPSPEIRYEAEEVYQEALEQAIEDEMLDDESMLSYLFEHQLWSADQDAMFEQIPKQIEDLKVKLFELTFKGNERQAVRRQIKALNTEYEKLSIKRYALYQNTQEGYANMAKNYFMLSKTLYYENELVRYIPDNLMSEIFACLAKSKPDEKTMREISRTEPWRSTWTLGKDRVFGCPPSCFSDEQKSLCLWSRMYDNVYEHPEAPHESVISDDDMLDGWFLTQRRRREEDMAKKQGDELISERMKKADEIYLVVDNIEDAKKVEMKNSTMGKITKAQRNNKIREKGVVKEADLPDRMQQKLLGGN